MDQTRPSHVLVQIIANEIGDILEKIQGFRGFVLRFMLGYVMKICAVQENY